MIYVQKLKTNYKTRNATLMNTLNAHARVEITSSAANLSQVIYKNESIADELTNPTDPRR